MEPAKIKNAIVLLFDSLNRHMLGSYGSSEFATPNFDAFAARSLRFNRHFTGSLPCMPARHDILVGAMDFLWRPWGSIEIWEDAITYAMRRKGITTMLVADHPHLFETGGENYHTDFKAWEYLRGHESDPWKTRPDPSWQGAPHFIPRDMPYDNSRGYFRDEADFPGPRTMQATVDWLRDHAPHHDEGFFLFVDEFDPHEPFDTPDPWARMYDEDWEGDSLIWPPYAVGAVEQGVISPRDGRQIRAQYGAKLSMIDHWFGRVMQTLETTGRLDDTLIILTTDHGHYLGEKDIWGKPGTPVQKTLGHIPLLVAGPGITPGDSDALTTSVDVFATLADLFDLDVRQRTHGKSLMPVLRGEQSSARDYVLTGVWGREVQVTDGKHLYARAPVDRNMPLAMYSNRWSTMPIHVNGPDGTEIHTRDIFPLPDERAELHKVPGSTVPVIRQPFQPGDMLPYWAGRRFNGDHLYDLSAPAGEEPDRPDSPDTATYLDLLRHALDEVDAPAEQYERMGVA